MKRLVICVVVTAFTSGLPAAAHAAVVLGEQKGTDNRGNKAENAFKWSHSFTLSGDQQEAPFRFNYHYGSLVDVESNYMSMNGPEYTKWHGHVPDTAQHFYYYESYGLGGEPDTRYIPPEGPYAAPEPMSILLMGLGELWIATPR